MSFEEYADQLWEVTQARQEARQETLRDSLLSLTSQRFHATSQSLGKKFNRIKGPDLLQWLINIGRARTRRSVLSPRWSVSDG